MNITTIKLEQELKQSENLWIPAAEFIAVPGRRYWVYVPSFPRGPLVKVRGAKKAFSTLLKIREVRFEVTHTWTGHLKPTYDPEGNML